MTLKLSTALVLGMAGIAAMDGLSYGPTGPTWNPGGGGSARKASKSTKAKRRNESSGRKAARKRK